MDSAGDPSSSPQGTHAQFTPTQWSLVLAASHGLAPQSEEALARLCRTYWYPLYAFIRRRGHPAHEAQDLTQDFFAHLFEHDTLKRVDRDKGRFRTFLLAALTLFLNNEWDKRQALKRGGGRQIVSWDQVNAESRYALEPADDVTPERIFERRWAFTLVDQVMGKVQQEYSASDKAAVFDALRHYLTGETGPGAYAEAAARLRMNEGAVKVALHRLRRRFGEMLRGEIAQTVATPEEAAEEIRHLFAAMSA
jgi:RNA polymerase sigma factor (sigma-70 family)